MKKTLLAVPVLGLALAGCQVTVTRTAPTISSLSTQPTYCTMKPTDLEFRFNATGLVTRVEVVLTNVDDNNPEDNSADDRASDEALIFGTGTVTGNFLVGDPTTNSVRVQAIIVTPVVKQLWVRAYNGTAASSFLKSNNVINPSEDPNFCDPTFAQ